ncbi:MAG: sigma-70 family RNA polymerase sigma factor [Solirubrobacteraceae bacterium]
MSTSPAAAARQLNPESRAWLQQLHAEGWVREAALSRLHALLLTEARHEVRRHTAGLAHPSGGDLDDLALQAADDALIAILGKLDRFRGDALFTTWAKRFAQLEVPGKIRRRLGHARATPIDIERWPTSTFSAEEASAHEEANELTRTLTHLITHELTRHQRDVLVALAINGVEPKELAAQLDCTPGALYKTLHDARRKLRQQLRDEAPDGHQRDRIPAPRSTATAPTRIREPLAAPSCEERLIARRSTRPTAAQPDSACCRTSTKR